MAGRTGTNEEIAAPGVETPGSAAPSCLAGTGAVRAHAALSGAVQGVGFRPFVHQLAAALELRGWVANSPRGVELEIEGPRSAVETFLDRLAAEKPEHAVIHGSEVTWLDPCGHAGFEIRASETGGAASAFVLPDYATCAACRRDLFDPENRRYRYPFTNCTHCGPRYSIVESLPYDRARTSMRLFTMCAACQAEYDNPLDRRFHAQPNACPACGPQMELWDADGVIVARREDALLAAADAIRGGRIVALKGLGGCQLLVDARSEAAVTRLRRRKHREEKPFAVMVPEVETAGALCEVSAAEAAVLCSSAAPIVLLRARRAAGPAAARAAGVDFPAAAPLADSVAPQNPNLGVMLPYTPLHHLLMADLGFPIVATSGNRSEEPICIDEHEALEQLRGIADVFLVHDRPIVRHVDDSIVRVLLGRELVLRRARGYAPLPVQLRHAAGTRLAVGAHLKSTVALAVDEAVFVSQHLGDLQTPSAARAFEHAIASLQGLYHEPAREVAMDAHPDYHSTRYARGLNIPAVEVQHHCAHVAACAAENGLEGPVLGVAWDGAGYGLDGTIWGGEFLRMDGGRFERLVALRPFRLPGGDHAAREPRRALLGAMFEIFGAHLPASPALDLLAAFSPAQRQVLDRMLERGVNAPWTSSVGRLFDAVAALTGLRGVSRFEGQAAMEVEFASALLQPAAETEAGYPIELRPNPARLGGVSRDTRHDTAHDTTRDTPRDTPRHTARDWTPRWILDWEPMLRAALVDRARGASAGTVARRFQLALVDGLVQVAQAAQEPRVVLSGGCFQNAFLTECAVRALEAAGFRPYWHQRIPPNDGGIALGQIAVAAWRSRPA